MPVLRQASRTDGFFITAAGCQPRNKPGKGIFIALPVLIFQLCINRGITGGIPVTGQYRHRQCRWWRRAAVVSNPEPPQPKPRNSPFTGIPHTVVITGFTYQFIAGDFIGSFCFPNVCSGKGRYETGSRFYHPAGTVRNCGSADSATSPSDY